MAWPTGSIDTSNLDAGSDSPALARAQLLEAVQKLNTIIAELNAGATSFDSVQLTGGTGTQGTVSWNVDEETLDIIQDGAVLQVGQELHVHCRNNTVSQIDNGTPVMATGTLGASGRITIAPMNGTDPNNYKYFIGVATEDIVAGADGKITTFGKVRGIDTSLWAEGTVLYVSPTQIGDFTITEPTGGDLNMPVAFTINQGANGTIMVRVTNINENHFALRTHTHTEADITDLGNYITDAPSDGSQYARQDGAWTAVTGGSGGAALPDVYHFLDPSVQWSSTPISFKGVDMTARSSSAVIGSVSYTDENGAGVTYECVDLTAGSYIIELDGSWAFSDATKVLSGSLRYVDSTTGTGSAQLTVDYGKELEGNDGQWRRILWHEFTVTEPTKVFYTVKPNQAETALVGIGWLKVYTI